MLRAAKRAGIERGSDLGGGGNLEKSEQWQPFSKGA